MVIMIAAAAENNALGKDNSLLWHLPDDFKRFKEVTTGHHIIMGRKTFEGFPKQLPNRTHIVITRQKDYTPENCIVVSSMDEALARVPANEDAYVIGGGQIYELGMAYADTIDLTRVHGHFEADAFFPVINPNLWKMVSETLHTADEKHKYSFSFQTFVRK
ncbi:dihydrofolate reductase [Flavobacterium sp.]|uniref:dihydrofolate reductase n=1 Tax=Flavobacterium sp. TaxID=239 RepID=UPI002606ED6D|nr:dihydrofolate reductase [Flavobacterium sp.]